MISVHVAVIVRCSHEITWLFFPKSQDVPRSTWEEGRIPKPREVMALRER